MRYFFALLLLFLPMSVFAATDVDIVPGSVTYSNSVLYSGDTVRLYATIRASGDVDVTGIVSFYLGDALIASPQISLKAGGYKEEVFVDFVVPDGAFNIRVEIRDIQPPETNTSNNITLTGLSTPIHDKDRDRVVDEQDNCPTVTNTDQRNTDNDTMGDVCDADKDNDGLTNEEELAKGTDPLDADTDDDGVADNVDKTPLGEPLLAPVQPKPVEKQSGTAATSTTSPPASSATAPPSSEGLALTPSNTPPNNTDGSSASPVDDQTVVSASKPSSSLSDRTSFSFEEQRWSTYTFLVVTPETEVDARSLWDFGDGSTSQRKEVTHQFPKAGSYTVSLSITELDGTVTKDQATIDVSFFDIENSAVRLLVASIFVLFVLGLSIFFRLSTASGAVPTTKQKKT